MIDKVRVPFPKYLNAKKLFYRWESDIVLAFVASTISLLLFFVWINLPIWLLWIAPLISYFIMRKYIKFFKKARKGYIDHLIYSMGYKDPINKNDINETYEEKLIPKGFENEFID